MSFDPSIWAAARQRLPLPYLMTKIGDGKFAKKNSDCPFCDGKKCFGVFEQQGRYRFKCHNTKPLCVANEPPNEIGHNEVGYLALRRNIGVKEASLEYLKLAVPDLLETQEKKSEPPKEKSKPKNSKKPERSNIVAMDGTKVPLPEPPKSNEAGSEPPPPKPNPFHALWKKLVLTPRDRTNLKSKRGFSDTTLEKLGFRSNNQSNRVHLENLAKEFSVDELISEGIYRVYKDGARPNPQLLGWGLSKRSRKDDEPDSWDWTEPPLIPYLSEDGTAFYLRPHKGGLGRPADEDDEETCSSHVYCPFVLSELGQAVDGLVVLCEGEFKAAALFQCGIPAIAIPGISFVRNRVFRNELLDLLRRFRITDMVICFDNEVKDDPKYPDKYKANPFDRWDTPMWAEYIAIDLTREYFSAIKGTVRIGILPDNLRENGKADFDSALAAFVNRARDVGGGTEQAKKVFEKVIEEARPHRKARELFPSESRRIIECKLQHLFYKPLVVAGGEEELKLAGRMQSIGESKLAAAYRSVVGCYYERESPDRDKKKLLVSIATACSDKTKEARRQGINGSEIRELRMREKAAWEHVKGFPVPISDFVLVCEFKLHTSDHKAIRLVKIRNRNESGKSDSRLLRLTGAEMSRGPEFMRWCYDSGKACWKGGQRKLADLCEDMDHHSFMRDIFEVNYYGYHADSGLWFFGDCAFNREGDRIEADANNIFWSEGIGYQVDSSVDERGTTFEQAAPMMLSPHAAKKKDVDSGEVFSEMCQDMFYTIGGYDAWLMLGLIFAYAAAPELLKQFGGHPSVWLTGTMSEGKTTVARWIMRVWGFKELSGIRINKGTTHVGMNRCLAQYCDLPVWFDEYRTNEIDPDKEGVLRGAFDRNSASKGLMDSSNRTRSARLYTTPVVTGESSSIDGATRSRYSNIIVTKRRRMGDGVVRHAKVQSESPYYYVIGRFLMEHRPEFVKQMVDQLEKWMNSPEVLQHVPNERVRLVYGTGWSAFTALSKMIGGFGAEERALNEGDFKTFLFTFAEQALQDVINETFITRFWTDVLSALQRGRVKKAFFQLRHVTIDADGRLIPAQEGDKDSMHVCYIAPNVVFDDYAQDLRARNEAPPIDLGDLRRQMAKELYWIPAPKSDKVRVHRASINGAKTSCWVINLAKDTKDNYVFPFADDFLEILDPQKMDDEQIVPIVTNPS